MSDFLDVATSAVKLAKDLGATDSECTISQGEEFSTTVRMRQVESLKQAGSRGAGIRVLLGQCVGSSYTSDLTKEGIETMVRQALDLAKISTEDPFAGLPDPADLGQLTGDLQIYDPAIANMEADWKIEQARKAEEAALSTDPRIENSEGGSCDTYLSRCTFANSRGFAGTYETSTCSISAFPVAKQNGSMEKDYWYSSARRASRLEQAENVGRKAAERALRRLNPRKIATQKVPVFFEPRTAKALLGELFEAINGGAIYRHASFLAGKLGQKIASENITVIDDPTLPGLFGSTPFDDEGVACRRNVIVDRGVLQSYILNTYTARKLGLKTTGSASRGITGNAGVGPGNFHLLPGEKSEADILRGVKKGLYVTELIGGGANTVTGDYSSGASGLWIENGELAYPVAEITIAGNLNQMLLDIREVAANLEFRSSIASPALLIGEMTISGQ